MANQSNLTVYQRLTKTLNGSEADQMKYIINRELIKDMDPEAYAREKLEAQQTMYLQGMWRKIDNELFQKAVFYEPTRIASYYDYESMEFSINELALIPTPNGFESIKDLAAKGRDYEFITYAYDHNTKQVVPALARNAHYTRDEMTYKIIFDDDTFIIATYGHRFLKRDGVYCKVEDLQIGDSMMPFYRKLLNTKDNWVYTCNEHIGHNGWVDEYTLMATYTAKLPNENVITDHPNCKHVPWDTLVEVAVTHKTIIDTAKALNVALHTIISDIKRGGYDNWETFIVAYDITTPVKQENSALVNHKIKSIEPYGIVPVYDLTVPGYKNFATDTIFSHNTPEIGAALDLYMEECCTANEDGNILQIYSESDRIKKILEELFYDVLDINSNLQPWTRNVCKYGDNFLSLKVLPQKGVIGCKQLPNIEITRVEPDFQKITSLTDLNREPNVKFFWKNKDMEFNIFEVAHFRLLGDDRKLPYGTCLAYGTAVATQCGYKEIQDVIIDDMVQSFNTTSQQFEYSKVLDVVASGQKQTYKISSKHYFIDASEEHKIMIYDKSTQNFVYKNILDIKLNDLLVGKRNHNLNNVVVIDKSQPDDFEKSLTYSKENHYWDNIDLIPNEVTADFAELFGFLIGDGSLDKNTIGFALGVHQEINNKYANLLEKFSGHKVKDASYDLQDSARCNSKMLVTILKRMGFNGLAHTKRIPSWVFNASTEIKESFINGFFQADGSINIDKWNCCLYTIEVTNEYLIRDLKLLVQSLGYKCGKVLTRQRENIVIKGIKVKNIRPTFRLNYYQSKNKQTKINDIKNRLTDEFILEPIISIEKSDFVDTYDIYVEHPEHNFVANNIVVHNSMLDKARRIWKQLCLDSETTIWTIDGHKKIKDVTNNDIVFSFDTANNNIILNKVAKCWETGKREVFEIKCQYAKLNVTDDHPIMVTQDKKTFVYKNINEINIRKDFLVFPTIDSNIISREIQLDDSKYFIKLNQKGVEYAKSINRVGIVATIKENFDDHYKNIHEFLGGHRKIKYKHISKIKETFGFDDAMFDAYYLYTNKPIILSKDLRFDISIDFMRFFGFMLGDGWTDKSGIGFALGVYEEQNQFYIDLCNKLFDDQNYSISCSKHSQYSKSVHVYSNEVKNILEAYGFITGFGRKRIPEWVFSLNKEHKEALITGLFDADGSDKWGVIGLANKKLVEDLRVLCLQTGISCGNIRKVNGGDKEKNGITVTRQDSYYLYINFNKRYDYNFVKIKSISNIGKLTSVWDIETTSEPHNFIAEGTVVHNCMGEDAMLTYRLSRAAERRVYKIFVGNMDDKDVDAYVDKVANSFRRTPVVDHANGNTDLRYNMLSVDQDIFVPLRDPALPMPIETLPGACIALDTKIPLLDGRTLPLSKIIEEYENGAELWAYSCHPETGKIVPGIISWAGVTRKNTQVLKITLDNGEHIITTPDHKFVHKTRGFIDAQNLCVGDSLMPFYRKKEILFNKSDYEKIFDNKTSKWVWTHSMVSKYFENTLCEYFVYDDILKNNHNICHHKYFNRANNVPDNLCIMGDKDHWKFHSTHSEIGAAAYKHKFENDENFRVQVCKRLYDARNSEKRRESQSETNKKIRAALIDHIEQLSNEEKETRFSKTIHSSDAKSKAQDNMTKWYRNPENKDIITERIREWKSRPEYKMKCSVLVKQRWLNPDYKDRVFYKEQKLKFSDKLYSIFLDAFKKLKRIDLTLIEVNQNKEFITEFVQLNSGIRSSITNLEEFTHNHVRKMLKNHGFDTPRAWAKELVNNYNHKIINIEWLNDLTDTGTITIDGNEKYHNYHTFAVDGGIFIKNSNLDAIMDIKYIQNKLLTALRIPAPFLGFDSATGGGKNLAMMDIRFARTIYRIQKAMIQELNKIAIIHLYLKGFEDELGNFTLTLTNPSTQQDLLKIERWREKVMLYRDAVAMVDGGFAAMSTTKAKKEILDMSDDEIKLDIQRQAVEKAAMEELKVLGETIKQTGIFKDLYDIYNIDPTNMTLPSQNGAAPAGGGGGGGGGGIGGGLLGDTTPPEGGESAEGGEPPAGDTGSTESPEEIPPTEDNNMEPLKEGFFRNGVDVRLETKRLSKHLEMRNSAINEDVARMLGELKILDNKKTVLD